jgi:hypothetical protein
LSGSAPLAFTRGDDLFQSDTKESFLVPRQTLRIFPESGEIPRERQQFPFLDIGERKSPFRSRTSAATASACRTPDAVLGALL